MPPAHRVSATRRLGAAVTVLALLCAAAVATRERPAATRPNATVWSAKTTAPTLTLAPLSTTAQYEASVVSATNAQRKAHGLKALTVTSCLTGLAEPWARHLAGTHSLTHQSLTPFLSKCNANYAAENIADGNVSASSVVTLWMNSSAHRANLLSSHYTHIGVGAAKSGSTWYVVQDFSG